MNNHSKDKPDRRTIMTTTTIPIRITGVRTVGVPVTDQDQALAFFVDTLGFNTVMDVPMPGMNARWITVAPAGSEVTIALVAHVALPTGVETGIRFVTPDADADHAGMLARSIDADDVLRWPGVPAMFAFRDPDGNGYELVEEA
jgi:catechol 2,3-dioxygenase-like lactoylglutathione lyase family enzyme